MPAETYQQLFTTYSHKAIEIKKRLRLLSTLRLGLFIISVLLFYFYFTTSLLLMLPAALLCLSAFLYLIRRYDAEKRKMALTKALMTINQQEKELLNGRPSPYENGREYTDSHHPYSYDLDLFGESSLFQYLNRTTTLFGKESLAKSLLRPDRSRIAEIQAAVKELIPQTHFRQHVQASGMIYKEEEKKMAGLSKWLKEKPAFAKSVHYYLLWLFPAAIVVSIILFFTTRHEIYKSLTGLLFVVNLGISFFFGKKMMRHILASSDISKTLQQFSEQLELIENSRWESPALKKAQQRLHTAEIPSSAAIRRLFSLFNYMDILLNVFVSPVLNGLFLFHIHILYRLDRWNQKYGSHVSDWLLVIGETEMLSSYASLAFNNPDFCFPNLSKEEDLSAVSMGHPLIGVHKRITNDISFREKRFVILTGSNMSGKSTFLRTLGVNLVLANAGAPVCASHFSFYPFDVFVSMRITDSLQDSESFFYAELKRLHSIIEHIGAGNRTFILLDEILRGTNSNDKHNGTVGLIRKLVSGKATGIIATHDLTVGALSAEYPSYLDNKCFESAIVNDELVFDYTIKEGVCTRLSASFLMKKMGIIEN